jgi:uncharacterized protein (DUF58 family)
MSVQSGIRPPAGRQGPGVMPSPIVETLDLVMARRASGALPGEHVAPGVGTGTELAQLRPYEVGDDVRQIDPGATARTGVPHIKLQVPERLLTTWIVLDLSPSMAFGTSERLKSDVAEGVVTVVGRLGTRRGGRIGLMTCGAPHVRFVRPRGGRGALISLQRVLHEGVGEDGAPPAQTLADAMRRIARMARQPGLVVVVSDFRGPLDWTGPIRSLAWRHSVLGVEVRDPRESALPELGHLRLVDPETGQQIEVDTSDTELRERYEAAERTERDAVATALRRARVEHVVLSTSGRWLKELGRKLR